MYGVWATDPRGLDPDAPAVRDPDAGARGVWRAAGPRGRVQPPAARVRRGGGLSPREDPAGGRPDALPAVPRLDAPLQSAVRARATRCRWRTGCETTCSCTTSWASTPDRRSPTSSRSSARSPCGRWWIASSGSCGGRFTSSTRSTASTGRRDRPLGIGHAPVQGPGHRRIAFAASPPSIPRRVRDIGRALSHRAIVAEAKWQGLDNVLVLEDDVVFSRRTARCAGAEPRRAARAAVGPAVPGRDEGQGSRRGVGRPLSPDRAGLDVSARDRLSPHRLRPDLADAAGHADGHGALAPDAHWGSATTMPSGFRRHEPGDVPLGRHSALPAPARGRAVRAAGGDLVTGERGASASRSSACTWPSSAIRPPWWRCWTATSCRGCRASRSARRRPIGLVEVRRAGDGDGLEILVDGAVAGAAPSPLTAIPRVQRALDEVLVRCQADVAVVHGGRRRATRAAPSSCPARPTRASQRSSRSWYGGAPLLLRRVRAHRRRRARPPVPPSAAAAGRVGLRSAPDWRRSWAARWRTSRSRRASSWGCAMSRTPSPSPAAIARPRACCCSCATRLTCSRSAVDPGADRSAPSGVRPATSDCGEKPREAAAAILAARVSRERAAMPVGGRPGLCCSTSAGVLRPTRLASVAAARA